MNWIRQNIHLNWRYSVSWLTIGLAALSLEILALVDGGTGDTLSEHTWFLLGFHPVIWFVALGFTVWLLRHFFLGRR